MNKPVLRVLSLLFIFAGTCLLLNGCSSTGYITTSVNTVLGLDVSENPKTQVPHVRFGFVRSQYYYIPTGKSPCADQGKSSCSAKEAPNLISEIYVKAQFLSETTIHEKFAVGEEAVRRDNQATKALFSFTPERREPIPPPR